MPPSAVAIVMTTLLPSQRVDHVYVGPEGMLVRQAQPTAVPEEDAEAEEETDVGDADAEAAEKILGDFK